MKSLDSVFPLNMWSYDLAREQTPSLDHLRIFLSATRAAGYNSFGLYLEHRYDYRLVPSHQPKEGRPLVDGAMIRSLEAEFPDVAIIPMVNLLGHMEGFLRSSGGESFSEEPFSGLQACPLNPATKALASQILDAVLSDFSSPLVHLGGDETSGLGACEVCKKFVSDEERRGNPDGKARLYADYFLPLVHRVIDAGRIPALWADMFLAHPTALDEFPRETVLFDWQYFDSPVESLQKLKSMGFRVVACPTLHTYNAAWCHLRESEANIRAAAQAVKDCGGDGTCLTTWEGGLFGSYETLLPAIEWAGSAGSGAQDSILEAYARRGSDYFRWADAMSSQLADSGPAFAFSRTRSGLRCRFLLYSNPFLLWLRQRHQFGLEPALRAKEVLSLALGVAPDAATRGVSEMVDAAMTFVGMCDTAATAYDLGEIGTAIGALAPARQIFDHLFAVAKGSELRLGGSAADSWRCRAAKEQVERAIFKIKTYGDGSLGYRPSFEHLVHPKFVPYDQGAWWLVNRWANE